MLDNNKVIEAVNNSTNYSAAAERMIGLDYKELNTANGILGSFAADKHVRIRLTNNKETSPTEINNNAQIEVDGINVGIPRRLRGNSYSFDFGRYGKSEYADPNIIYNSPTSNDDDFEDGTVSDNKYYVDMYAVAVGRDTTFKKYYSNVTYLGSITINASLPDN